MTVNQAHGVTARAGSGPWHWPVPPDPGDLSRRLAARRTELRLSVSQVAWRARVEPRYLAYLENFPGHPDAATLRQLAAALRTTSAALLGAGQEASPGRDPKEACWGSAGVVERLIPAECYRLLAPRGIGRIAFDTASGPAVAAGELRGDRRQHRDQDWLRLDDRRARRRPGLVRGRPL